MREPAPAANPAVSPPGTSRLTVCVIFNPNAGMRRRGLFQRTLDALDARGCDVWLHRTDGAGDAEAIARGLPSCDRLVVAGGDGTVHEAINGLRGRDLPLAVIPLGTANVLAKEIGLARDPERVARTIVDGNPRPIQLGEVNGRLFVQMMGVGFDARVIARLSRRLKRRLGRIAFVVAFVHVMAGYGRDRYTVTFDDGTQDSAPFVVVANGRFYGGAFRMAPEARLTAPGLHVCLFRRGGMRSAIRYGLALITNRLPERPDFAIRTGSRLHVAGPVDDPIQADGECATRLPAEVRTRPGAATLMMPPDAP